jgi:hypothetical protein
MELDKASTSPTDGGVPAVVIDADRHPVLYAALRRRIAGRSTLYLDKNHDGKLDREDRDAIVGDGSDDPD